MPRLERRVSGVRLFQRQLRVTGLGESHVEQRILPIYGRYSDVTTTILAAPGEIQIHLRMWTTDAAQAKKTLDEMVQGFEIALTDRIYSEDGRSLEEVVAHELTANGATISAAESCTGGLLAQRLTSIAGSSSYFLGGVVCYSNELKTAWADVPPEMILSKGAVSAEVAVALAEGIRRRVGSTIGVGITGIAGPGGGTEEKPVGTVHVAISYAGGVKERGVRFPGERENIRWQASQDGAGYGAHPLSLQWRENGRQQGRERRKIGDEEGLNRAPVRRAADSRLHPKGLRRADRRFAPTRCKSRAEKAEVGAARESARHTEIHRPHRSSEARFHSHRARTGSLAAGNSPPFPQHRLLSKRESPARHLGRHGGVRKSRAAGSCHRSANRNARLPRRRTRIHSTSHAGATRPAGNLSRAARRHRKARRPRFRRVAYQRIPPH